MSTILFTWNKSSYVEYPIYDSGSGETRNQVSNITTQSVKLSAPLDLTTTLLITNTTTSDGTTEFVEETYQFSTINGYLTLGTATFSTAYSQPVSQGTTTLVPSLSASSLFGNGIFAEVNNLQVVATFDNNTGVRTVSVIPVR